MVCNIENPKTFYVMSNKSCLRSVKLNVDRFGRIYFTAVSTGTSVGDWERRLEDHGCFISGAMHQAFASNSLVPTRSQIYRVIVCPSAEILKSDHCVKNIRDYGFNRRWKTPHWEVACFIRLFISNEFMEDIGVWSIITMHAPITVSGKGPYLINANRLEDRRCLGLSYGGLYGKFSGCNGFAFEF